VNDAHREGSNPMPTRRSALAAAVAVLFAPGLAASAEERAPVPVVATFSVLGDFVRNVGGDRIRLTTLVGPDGDGHVYAPTPADARRLAEAKVVIANGLGYEGWIGRLARSSGTKATLVEAAKGIAPLKEEGGGHPGHGHAAVDPHAWQSVPNAKVYVAAIRDSLAAADPAGKENYEANAAAYGAKLDALDAEVRAAVARIPADRRRVITSHDAFGYFEKAYGLDFVAPQGVSTEAEASAKDVARIIGQIKRERIGAVFLENVSDPRLVERIARETGAKVGPTIYSDALSGPDGPAPTYIEMTRHNMGAIAAALSS
jgi:zinc/manganese transport system substrate-binding protein